jgi:uncharacterized protein
MINRPLPFPDVESQPFWDGCAQGKLMLQKCGDIYQFPPTRYCTSNLACAPQWEEVSGSGTVYSWIVVHVGIPRDIFGSQTPYVSALITLDEGPRICTTLVDVAPGDIYDGMPVKVVFTPVGDGSFVLPFFRPAT